VVEDAGLAAEAGADAGEAGEEASSGWRAAKEGETPTNYWTKVRAAKFRSRGGMGVFAGGPQAYSEYVQNNMGAPPSSPSSSGLPSGPRTDPYAASRAVNEEGQSDRSGGPSGAIDPYG
jgi:hypothetical protein